MYYELCSFKNVSCWYCFTLFYFIAAYQRVMVYGTVVVLIFHRLMIITLYNIILLKIIVIIPVVTALVRVHTQRLLEG